MNRTQLAGYSLMASAFVLAAGILMQAPRFTDGRAHAGLVSTTEDATVMTVRKDRAGTDAVWILDSKNEQLAIYVLSISKKIAEPKEVLNLGELFQKANRGGR